ncbi:MAG: NADH:ubiquinone reductase (Na(+)-transporting) subunit D [Candidatus Riflebacteria bacterium]|nr:NADH:ubiquinone reductase (Na(+)-transporting) subunit D [Candidatus Riflebacteria bacterium]
MRTPDPRPGAIFREGLWTRNPIFAMVLGICSALAVTTTVRNTLVMFLGVLFASVLTSVAVSLLRHRIPGSYRLMVEMLLASTLVIVFDRALRLVLPAVSRELGPYVGLIITNCLVMGRAEAFAMTNPPLPAALDAAGCCTGYGLVMLAIALVREPLGLGTLAGYPVMPAAYEKCGLLVSPPGAFLCLAALLLLVNTLRDRRPGGEP